MDQPNNLEPSHAGAALSMAMQSQVLDMDLSKVKRENVSLAFFKLTVVN